MRDVMIRYGWPRWYTRTRPEPGSMRQPQITEHDGRMPYDFLPSARAVDHVGLIGNEDWNLDDRAARTGYAPEYARSVHDIPHQIALFRRGDSTLAVAAWDARHDTTLAGRALDASLVLSSDAAHTTVSRLPNMQAVGRISVTAAIDSGVVSLELLAVKERRAARVRVGLPARSAESLEVSDLLLYAPSSEAPSSLDAVRDSALTSDIIPADRAVGVYWEAYGLARTDGPVHLTLTVEQMDVGFIRHVAEALRFADPTTALRIQWQEMPEQTNGVAGRGVRVDFSQLRSGRYRIQLMLGSGDKSAVKSRIVVIR
jgi:hypothetical protein